MQELKDVNDFLSQEYRRETRLSANLKCVQELSPIDYKKSLTMGKNTKSYQTIDVNLQN